MIRSLLICSSLVLASGAGAVALSALHDSTMTDRSARTLAPAPVAKVEPRFVIPTFAPATVQPEATVIQASLRAAPELTTNVLQDTSPATPSLTDAIVPQSLKQKAVASRVATPKPARHVATPTTLKPRYKAAAPRPTAAPIIVAQAPAFRASATAQEPDYLIGVFR